MESKIFQGLFFALAAFVSHMNAETVYVSNSNQLQTALDAAHPGDIILLNNGLYVGNFLAKQSGNAQRPISIRGASGDAKRVQVVGINNEPAIFIEGDDYNIESLTVTGQTGVLVKGVHFTANNLIVVGANVGFNLEGSGASIRDITIEDAKSCGILVKGAQAAITEIRITETPSFDHHNSVGVHVSGDSFAASALDISNIRTGMVLQGVKADISRSSIKNVRKSGVLMEGTAINLVDNELSSKQSCIKISPKSCCGNLVRNTCADSTGLINYGKSMVEADNKFTKI